MGDYLLVLLLILNVVLLTKSFPDRWSYQKRNTKPEINSSSVNDDIVFPDVVYTTTSLRYSGNSKEEVDFSANGKGLNCIEDVCDDAKDYPYERIKEIVNQISMYKKLFGFLEGSVVETPNRFKPGAEDDGEGESLCATNTHTKYPKLLKNENNTEKFIVNVDGHKQGLVIETCVEKAECKFASRFPDTYTSECRQRYARRRLMAVGEDGNPAFDTFIVPSCCVCTVKKIK